jgi:hypothetical protein
MKIRTTLINFKNKDKKILSGLYQFDFYINEIDVTVCRSLNNVYKSSFDPFRLNNRSNKDTAQRTKKSEATVSKEIIEK